MRIPPEIDQTMWGIAESGSDAAADQFRGRHPEYATELDKRLEMVRGLKKSSPVGRQPKNDRVPAFRNPRLARPAPTSPRLPWAIGGLGLSLAVLAAVLFWPAPTAPVQKVTPTGSVAGTRTAPSEPPASNPSPPAGTQGGSGTIDPGPGTNPNAAPTGTSAGSGLAPAPPQLQPQDFRFREAKLSDALRMIAAQGALQIQFLPNFVDSTVEIDLPQRTPIGALQELGKQYGFTPFDQGNGTVIIVPARESPTIERGSPGPESS